MQTKTAGSQFPNDQQSQLRAPWRVDQRGVVKFRITTQSSRRLGSRRLGRQVPDTRIIGLLEAMSISAASVSASHNRPRGRLLQQVVKVTLTRQFTQ